MVRKSQKAQLRSVISVRVTDEIFNLLKSKALREKIEIGAVIRDIIEQYFEDTLSDSKIINQNLVQTKRKVSMLDNKIEIMSMLVLELTKSYMNTFPDRQLTPEISEKAYEEIITRLSENMKNHKGRIESMVLDIYEKGGNA
jgi:hypothetical protein